MNGKSQKQNDSLSNSIFSKWSFEPIFIFDENYICLNVNDAATRIFQYDRDNFIGQNLSFLVAKEDIPLMQDHAFSSSNEPYQVKLIRKDGSVFHAMIQGQTTHQDGQTLRITTCRDISEIKAIQKELEYKNRKLESIFNNNLSGIVVLNKNRIIQQVNQIGANIVGYNDPNDLVGKSILDLHVSKEIYEEFTEIYLTSLMKGQKTTKEIQLEKKDGSKIWVRVSGSLISTDTPPKLDDGIAWVIDDISKVKEAEKKMLEAYNELEVIFNNALVGILVVSKDRIIQKVNQTFVDMVGRHTAKQWEGKSVREFHLSDESYERFGVNFFDELINKQAIDFDYQVKGKDGKPIWVAVSGQAIDKNIPADLTKGVVWATRDITARKQMEQQLLTLTREDALTGLYNRRYFLESSARENDLMRRYDKKLSLLMIDIDKFKQINDTFGHDIGDRALLFFSQLCLSIVRNIDIVGRVGGEEFAILLIESDIEQANIIAQRILTELAEKSLADQDIPTMNASIGAVQIGEKEELLSAMKRADKLLYHAKQNGRNRVISE